MKGQIQGKSNINWVKLIFDSLSSGLGSSSSSMEKYQFVFDLLYNLRVCDRHVPSSGSCRWVGVGSYCHKMFSSTLLNDVIPFNFLMMLAKLCSACELNTSIWVRIHFFYYSLAYIQVHIYLPYIHIQTHLNKNLF